MNVEIKNIDIEDIDQFDETGLNGRVALEGHCKMIVTDENGNSGYMFMPTSLLQELGVDYISSHVSLHYSEVLADWFVSLSQSDYHNDLVRNPPKVVKVRFVTTKVGENTEVWQNVVSGRYYLRMLCNEPFARWMTCGNRASGWEDHNLIRPNITFQNVENGNCEGVRYDDWNDVAAYSDLFNPNFRSTK